MAVLHQHFTEIGQLGFMPLGLLEQPAVGIGRRLMRLIRAPFPMEIDGRIPRVVGRFVGLILPCETLLPRPRLEQRAIAGEMLGGQQATAARSATTSSKKARAMSPASSRSRFLVNVVGTQTASSIAKPTNQRNSRLYSSCSISIRSLRTEYSTWSSSARNKCSGG